MKYSTLDGSFQVTVFVGEACEEASEGATQ
jgi:hypothetical protein